MSGGVDNFNDVIPAPITLPRESDGVFVLRGVIPSRSANETQQVHASHGMICHRHALTYMHRVSAGGHADDSKPGWQV